MVQKHSASTARELKNPIYSETPLPPNPNKTNTTVDLAENYNYKKSSKCSNCCKQCLRLTFSHIGLIVLVLIFIISGAYLFRLLEEHASIQKCEEGEGVYNQTFKKLHTYIFNYLWLNRTIFDLPYREDNNTNRTVLDEYYKSYNTFLKAYDSEIGEKLKNFSRDIYNISKTFNYNNGSCIYDTSWTIESAILFSMTLITTIGYGHVTPITWEGQIVCICFSMVGIPLFLLSVANASVALGDLFRKMYSKIFHFVCCSKKKTPKDNKSASKTQSNEDMYNQEVSNDFMGAGFINEKKKSHAASNDDPNDDQDEMLDDELSDADNSRVSVPLALAITIICLYIGLGAVIFTNLEEWSHVQSSYFSFITMATIGFGDLVPGITALKNGNKSIASRNLLIAGIYLFFGIAILAMCFDLLQEELIIKFSNMKQLFATNIKRRRNIILNRQETSDGNNTVFVEEEGFKDQGEFNSRKIFVNPKSSEANNGNKFPSSPRVPRTLYFKNENNLHRSNDC